MNPFGKHFKTARNVALLSVVCVGGTAMAKSLSQNAALESALVEMNQSYRSRSAVAVNSRDFVLERTFGATSGKPVAYLFSSDSLAMLVSSDDVARPLLGYFDAGSILDFNKLPPAVEWYINELGQEIETASEMQQQSAAVLDFRQEWASVAPLCSTSWGQDMYFNNSCPLIDGQHCVTGCVPTAMAQVMKYYSWPDCGEGSISYATQTRNLNLSMEFNQPFDWDNMLDKYTGEITDAQTDAVAMLMKSCGYAVQADYNINATGSAGGKMKDAFTRYFKYEPSCQYVSRHMFSSREWETLIYKNLTTCGPVVYTGNSAQGAHAFVCDGYSTDGYFHINWGWSGAFDGYFLLSALDTGNENFTQDHCALIGLRPLGKGENPFPDYSPIVINLYAELGEHLVVKITFDKEPDPAPEIGLCLEDNSGNKHFVAVDAQTWVLSQVQLTAANIPLPDGIYCLTPAVKDADGNWKELILSNMVVEEYSVRIENGTTVEIKSENLYLKATDLQLKTEVYDGSDFKVKAIITNPTDRYLSRQVSIAIYDRVTGSTPDGLRLVADNTYVDLAPGESGEYEFSAYVYCTPPLTEQKDYVLLLKDNSLSTDCEGLDFTMKMWPLPEVVKLEVPETFYYAPDVIKVSLKGPYEGAPFWIFRDKATRKQVGGFNHGSNGEALSIPNGEIKEFEFSGCPSIFSDDWQELTIALHDGDKAKDLTPEIPVKIVEPTFDLAEYRTSMFYPSYFDRGVVRFSIRNTSPVKLSNLTCNAWSEGLYSGVFSTSLEQPFALEPGETIDCELEISMPRPGDDVSGEHDVVINIRQQHGKEFEITRTISVLETSQIPEDYHPELTVDQFVSEYDHGNLKCTFNLRCSKGEYLTRYTNFFLFGPEGYLTSLPFEFKCPLLEGYVAPVSLDFQNLPAELKQGDKCRLTLQWIHPDKSEGIDCMSHEFTPVVQSGIEDVTDASGDAVLEVSGDRLLVKNAPAGTVIAVYGIDGSLVEQRTSSRETECFAIDKKGVYVLVIGHEAYKIVL